MYVGVDTAVKFTAAAAAAVVAACSSSWGWARTCSAFVVSFLALVVRPERLSPRGCFVVDTFEKMATKFGSFPPRYFDISAQEFGWHARQVGRSIVSSSHMVLPTSPQLTNLPCNQQTENDITNVSEPRVNQE